MVLRKKNDSDPKPAKMAQIFFCLDAETEQPLCFTTATSAKTATQATIELMNITADIIKLNSEKPLILADNEHYTVKLFDWIYANSPFDLLTPMHNNRSVKTSIGNIPEEAYKRHWAGYATAKALYRIQNSKHGTFHQFVQRKGEQEYDFKAFLCTSDRDEMEDLSANYPQRWHIEEFFKNYQAMGWKRAGTWNLNIQYGKMTMALFAQAASFMMRQRLGPPAAQWDAQHLALNFFRGLEGDIRVKGDTIIVTYYNAPNPEMSKLHYQNPPQKLEAEGLKPNIPWLFDFKLDFRFK